MNQRWKFWVPVFLSGLMILFAGLARTRGRAAESAGAHVHHGGVMAEAPEVKQAVALMVPMGHSGVQGVIYLTAEDGRVRVQGKVTGLKPLTKHAFHVHEFGDLTDVKGGLSAGGHYNPMHMPHGRPTDKERHAGDFGNIEADAQGVATLDFEDPMVRLRGPHSVIGRSLVIHADPDQFTQPVGNAGGRIAVGVIGIAKPAK
jgi:superoxide dismutase, Cu-Zn family